MIAPLFHAWERHLASVSKDRLVRPFEWGTEWLPDWCDSTREPEAQVKAWIDAVMEDSAAFFSLPYTPDFAYTPAAPGHESKGGLLTFPSAFQTPDIANNTVHARWFPSAGDADLAPSTSRGRAVVILPQWNADAGGHIGLAQLLARCGVSALRLSLPYHDARMPHELTRADYIVSPNIVRTVQVCRQAVLDARAAIAWLASHGFERIGILGTSLGSCLSLLTTAHEPRIRAQALNHVSPWFADVVWRGLSTRHVRAGLEGHIELDTLRDLWRPISPFSYLDRVSQTNTLLVYARYDLTFPIDLSFELIDAFAKRGLRYTLASLPCGHYSTGMAPFKYLDAFHLVRFLRRAL